MHRSLIPRTEVYTHENGSSALLLTISGNLPVDFRGTTYRFPVKLWVPQAFPQEPPVVYVTPGREMLVRPSQHISVDGRVYHPYLKDWSRTWDRASTSGLLEILQQVFAKEPPVISKAQQQQFHQRPLGQHTQSSIGGPSLPPQLPPKQRLGDVEPVEMPSANTPPPRPPKPGKDDAAAHASTGPIRGVNGRGPPLPPLPHERPKNIHTTDTQRHRPDYEDPSGLPPSGAPRRPVEYSNGRPRESPVAYNPAQHHQHRSTFRTSYTESPVSPVSPTGGHMHFPNARYAHAPLMSDQQPHHHQPRVSGQSSQQSPYQQAPPASDRQVARQSQAHHRQGPPPDLLSDPFDVALPNASSFAAPPIPPNPEREHLLYALSTSLTRLAQEKIGQNYSAMAALQAQNVALLEARSQMDADVRQLERLSATLDNNDRVLRGAIADCDATIARATEQQPPDIDDVLIAPTTVAQQLWTVCAEEEGCREAIYVLQRAVDRGRVGGPDFVRSMRGLGRECFLKMVLARKIATGLGLVLDRRGTKHI